MNFKKCTSLFLAFLLLVSNAGLAFNVHYCGGEIASISSVFLKEEACEMPVVEKPCCVKAVADTQTDCCSDKVVNFKAKSNDVVIKAFSFQVDMALPVSDHPLPKFNPVSIAIIEQKTTYYCEAHAPPLFKLYSQYIFYA